LDSDTSRVLVNVIMILQIPWNARNFLTSWEAKSFPRRTLLHGVIEVKWNAWVVAQNSCAETSTKVMFVYQYSYGLDFHKIMLKLLTMHILSMLDS
jgi:hypothetical protein